MKARIIRVNLEHSEKRHYATSPDLPGLFATESTEEELREVLPNVIKLLLEMDGDRFVVTEAEDDSGFSPFVAVPKELVALSQGR